MTSAKRERFTVITNENYETKEPEKKRYSYNYQTDPLREKFMKFVNNEAGRKFSVEDLLKW